MAQLRKLPIGIQDFESLRGDGYLYVDKTEQIYRMISTGRYYFLSRPRRFGKSLLMSTLHAFYSGKKDLFDGTVGQRLAIADKADVTWEKHPVLHLDLNTENYNCPEALTSILNEVLAEWEESYGKSDAEISPGRRFQGVIRRAAEQSGKRVVILVDEYDKPLVESIGNPELQEAYRDTLRGFYGALKSMDGCIALALLTGVTKFGKVSVFSGLNNLNDISMDADYWDICGLNEKELLSGFKEEIQALAEANNLTYSQCVEKLRLYYDGYHFHPSASGVYNPFSVLSTLSKKTFGSYWFETGTPTYLAELLKKSDFSLEDMSHVQTSADVLSSIDASSQNPISVIYQSGYLTIKAYDPEFGLYTLGFPNKEVESGFLNFLLPLFASVSKANTAFCIRNFIEDVRTGQTERFLARLRSLFADTPYELVRNLENHYQNVLWLLAKLMGFHVQAEYHTSQGRIDLVLQSQRYCYVMEFKLDGTAEEALDQIDSRQYALPFALSGQQVIRIGLNFDSRTRNIGRYLIS